MMHRKQSRSTSSPTALARIQPKHPAVMTESTLASQQSPDNPVLRANPFPEVTDLICRLPLPTLFYRREAIHLENLMRFRYGFGLHNQGSLVFSRVMHSTRDGTETAPLYATYNHISS